MTTLRSLRADLGAHLAAGLGVVNTKLGAQVNPPAVEVRPAPDYVLALDYCTDQVQFQVVIVTKPGDIAAAVDALDDLVDQVRATLRVTSPAGNRYSFRTVSGLVPVVLGETELPGVVATVVMERQAP